ncbi:hypothetical protein DsansV1_C06g0063441 [Dioscorea sansibarensis]
MVNLKSPSILHFLSFQHFIFFQLVKCIELFCFRGSTFINSFMKRYIQRKNVISSFIISNLSRRALKTLLNKEFETP